MKSKKIRVLTAEDDYLISEEISRILKLMEYDHVGDASDGQEAVEMTCELHPDVILMDIKMPRMDGLTFLKYLMCCTHRTGSALHGKHSMVSTPW